MARSRRLSDKDVVAVEDRGGVVVRSASGDLLHVAPSEVTTPLRYFLSKAQHGSHGIPSRLGFTAALSGEGVTYVARTVGAILAHDLRQPVCVVELNWAAAPAGEADEWSSPRSFVDVLSSALPLESALSATDDPNLTLLRGGHASPSQRQVIAHGTVIEQAIEQLSARYAYLVLDLPSVLAASEAPSLARFAEAVAVVVRHGVVTESQLKLAIDRLGGVPTLGVVMNRVAHEIPPRLLHALSPA